MAWLTRYWKFLLKIDLEGGLTTRPFLFLMIPKTIRALILDMDGVIWKGDAPIGELSSIFTQINAQGLKVVFATNNGTRTPEQYVKKLAAFGVMVEKWQIVTSAIAVAYLLRSRLPPGELIYAIGEAGLLQALEDNGFEILPDGEAEKAKAVVMSFDNGITFRKMSEAALLVKRGIPFFVTNQDKTFPTPRGEIPGAGAWISVVTTATGIMPISAGKPAPYMMDLARERLGYAKEEILVVGDRIETDIAGGQEAGFPVALVLSGVSTKEQGLSWKPKIDFITRDLSSLIEL